MSRSSVRGHKTETLLKACMYTRAFFFANAIFPCSLKKVNPQWSVQCKCWLTFPNSLRPGVESWVLFVSPTEQTALPRKCLLERWFASLAAKIQRSHCGRVLALAFSPLGRVSDDSLERTMFSEVLDYKTSKFTYLLCICISRSIQCEMKRISSGGKLSIIRITKRTLIKLIKK